MNSPEDTSIEKENQITDSDRYKSDLRHVKIVLRRLSIDQKVETTLKRKLDVDQSKMPEFVEYSSSGDKYFTTHQQSVLPESEPSDKNIDLYEKKQKFETNNTLERSIVSHNEDSEHIATDKDNGKTIKKEKSTVNQKKKSQGYNFRDKTKKNATTPNTSSKAQNKSHPVSKKRQKVVCPHYKIIEGTSLAVDAFRYGDIEKVEHYFLSHFHADHYIGLKKSFNHNLYVSNITGRLVIELMKVKEQYVHCLDINIPTIVDEVEVTALDANQ